MISLEGLISASRIKILIDLDVCSRLASHYHCGICFVDIVKQVEDW